MIANTEKISNRFLAELALKIERKTSSKVSLSKLLDAIKNSEVWIYDSLEQFYNNELFSTYMFDDLIDEFLSQLNTPVSGTFNNALAGDLIFDSKITNYIVGNRYVLFFDNSLESVLVA